MQTFKLNKRLFRKSFGIFVVLLTLFFLGRRLSDNWKEIQSYSLQIDYIWLGASLILLFLYYLLLVNQWLVLLGQFRVKLPYKRGLRIWSFSQLGRYLPGKVWLLVGRAYLCEKEGIEKSIAIASLILELTFLLVSGSLIVLLLAPILISDVSIEKSLIPCVISLIGGFLIIHPFFFQKLFNIAAKKLKTDVQLELTYLQSLKFVGRYLLLWGFFGLAFFAFIHSIYPIKWNQFFPVMGTYTFAWLIGFLSFVTPGGIGIREGLLSLMLQAYMPPTEAIVAALLSRIWGIAVECVCAGIAWRF